MNEYTKHLNIHSINYLSEKIILISLIKYFR